MEELVVGVILTLNTLEEVAFPQTGWGVSVVVTSSMAATVEVVVASVALEVSSTFTDIFAVVGIIVGKYVGTVTDVFANNDVGIIVGKYVGMNVGA